MEEIFKTGESASVLTVPADFGWIDRCVLPCFHSLPKPWKKTAVCLNEIAAACHPGYNNLLKSGFQGSVDSYLCLWFKGGEKLQSVTVIYGRSSLKHKFAQNTSTFLRSQTVSAWYLFSDVRWAENVWNMLTQMPFVAQLIGSCL